MNCRCGSLDEVVTLLVSPGRIVSIFALSFVSCCADRHAAPVFEYRTPRGVADIAINPDPVRLNLDDVLYGSADNLTRARLRLSAERPLRTGRSPARRRCKSTVSLICPWKSYRNETSPARFTAARRWPCPAGRHLLGARPAARPGAKAPEQPGGLVRPGRKRPRSTPSKKIASRQSEAATAERFPAHLFERMPIPPIWRPMSPAASTGRSASNSPERNPPCTSLRLLLALANTARRSANSSAGRIMSLH